MMDVMRFDVKPNVSGKKLEILTKLAITPISTLLTTSEGQDTTVEMSNP